MVLVTGLILVLILVLISMLMVVVVLLVWDLMMTSVMVFVLG